MVMIGALSRLFVAALFERRGGLRRLVNPRWLAG
jgi:hypothetical protein